MNTAHYNLIVKIQNSEDTRESHATKYHLQGYKGTRLKTDNNSPSIENIFIKKSCIFSIFPGQYENIY
jgi:hypothetical protein